MIQYICACCDSLSEADVEVLTSGAKLICNECGKTTDVYLSFRWELKGPHPIIDMLRGVSKENMGAELK